MRCRHDEKVAVVKTRVNSFPGITGRTQDEPAATVGARKTLTGPLARLSEMIPPPPVTTGSDDSGSDDGADWVAD